MITDRLRNLKLKTHMMISMGGITFMAVAITIAFVSFKTVNMAKSDAIARAHESANRYSNFIDAEIEVAMDTARALAQAFEGIIESKSQPDRAVMTSMLKQVFEDNSSAFFGMSSCWEPDALDGRDSDFANKPYHDSTGRFIPYVYLNHGKTEVAALTDYDKPGSGDWYLLPKKSGEECISEPSIYPINGADVLMITLSAPIKSNGKFIGVVTVDLAMSAFAKLVADIKIYETGYMSIISNRGIYAAHPNSERLGKPLIDSDPWASPFLEDIGSGKGFTTESYSKTIGTQVSRICVPINVGRTTTPWAVLINIPKNEVIAGVKKMMLTTIIIGALFLIAVMIIISLLTSSITAPIIRSVEFARKISEGDFTQHIDINQSDEIGIMSASLNEMASGLGTIFGNIRKGVQQLSSSSSELSQISQHMAEGSKKTSDKSVAVNQATQEMADNINSVAAASEEALTNLGFVAAATEEMSASIQEIAKDSDKARSITSSALAQTQRASERVNELGNAAQEIGKVTEVITTISAQTNLLALNATIEAARAGDAGKGFAVVASEIKLLAQQTSSATGEIRKEIERIQNAISVTVGEIKLIADVNSNVNDIVSRMASAVSEQSATTDEVAQNIAQASQGFSEVNQKVAESAELSNNITEDISQINQNAKEMSESSAIVQGSAADLAILSKNLEQSIIKFKI